MTRVLFVCLGNICRSPTAHAVFQSMAADAGLAVHVASGGIGGWHVGEPPDGRSQLHAKRRGYDLSKLRAKQVGAKDFAAADLVLAMDRDNLAAILRDCPPEKARLFLDFAPDQPTREVPDPYYGGDAGFERVIDLVEAASRGLIGHLKTGAAVVRIP